MISVKDALNHLFTLVSPLDTETVDLRQANGRVLRHAATAQRDQPPFAASAMDGYALRQDQVQIGAQFTVIGEAAAGHRFERTLKPGEAVRIFTGAPVPAGANHVVIQEDVNREGDQITLLDTLGNGANIRPAGGDFHKGDPMHAPRLLGPSDIALLASMNVPQVQVTRKPRIALLSTGDELVIPGEAPGPDQIIASNTFGLDAMLRTLGAEPRILPIARDNRVSLKAAISLSEGADMLVTIGGASVGDHDLVADVAAEMGLARSFYKVAMRPGKPLMAGRLGDMALVGLPGNPVSAMVCGHIFLTPMIRLMLGLGAAPAARKAATLTTNLPANGPREHYMRANVTDRHIAPADRQDSSLLSVLAQANALMIRPPNDQNRTTGEVVDYIPL